MIGRNTCLRCIALKYIWGIDVGLGCTGVTVYDKDKKEFIHTTSIKTDKIKVDEEAGYSIHGEKLFHIEGFLNDLKKIYPPDEIAIEKGFTRFNKSTQVTFRVHGIVNKVFHDIKQFYYTAGQVKKAITGSGRADEFGISLIIKDYLDHLNFENFDESDSAGILITHLINKYKFKPDYTMVIEGSKHESEYNEYIENKKNKKKRKKA